LRIAFRLMVNAGAASRTEAVAGIGAGVGAGRHYTVRQAPPSGELALARAHGMQRHGHRGIR
jgi:hypothetical protein